MNARGVVAVAVLAAWGAGLAVFAQREGSRSASDRLAESAVRVSPGASYFKVEEGNRHVGFASFTTDTVRDGLQFSEYEVRDRGPGDARGRRVQQVVTRASRALVLREVIVTADSLRTTAWVTNDSTLTIVKSGPAGADTLVRHFAPPLLVPALVPMAIALGASPDVGDRYAFDVFDPAITSVRSLTMLVRAESTWVVPDSAGFDPGARQWRQAHVDTVHAWRVVEPSGGMDLWVDELGRTVHAVARGNATHSRTAYELAFENWRATTRSDVASTPASPLPSVTTSQSSRVRALTLVVRGLPIGELAAGSPWQQVSGDTLRTTWADVRTLPAAYWLPPSRDFRAAHARELQVEPGMEVESPAIVAASRRLRGTEANPLWLTRRLARWVSDSVRLEAEPTPLSALATLRSAAGDADHHTLLFVALARASGMPARPVRGVVWRDPDWLSHSWAEVFLGGLWIPVDPTTGQVPADAAHVRLATGRVAIALELDRLVSRARLTVLSSTLAPGPHP